MLTSFDEFIDSILKGKSFSLLACLRSKKTPNSLPCGYTDEERFHQAQPISIGRNIKINFIPELTKLIDKNTFTLVITQEALFNHALNVNGFSPIEKSYVYTEKDHILKIFLDESVKFAKAVFFINLIFDEESGNLEPYKGKMREKLSLYDNNLKNPLNLQQYLKPGFDQQKRILLQKKYQGEYDYLIFPMFFDQDHQQNLHHHEWANYWKIQKTINGESRFSNLHNPKNIVRYFSSGILGHEQKKQKYKHFFEHFALEICFDYANDVIKKDLLISHQTPLIRVLQSDSISSTQGPMNELFFMHIDADKESCKVLIKNQASKESDEKEFDERIMANYFLFLKWKDLKKK